MDETTVILDTMKLGRHSDAMVGCAAYVTDDGQLHILYCTETSDGGVSYGEVEANINFCPMRGIKFKENKNDN